jgi:asparagine synthetase B (glutamine-hydrolysing)
LKELAPPSLLRYTRSLKRRRTVLPWLTPEACRVADSLTTDNEGVETFLSETTRRHWEALVSARMIWVVERERFYGAQHGIDVRFPFLDRELVDFVLALPHHLWPEPRHSARLHRAALREILPSVVVNRTTKASFAPAMAHRVHQGQDRIRRILTEGHWAAAQYVERPAALAALDDALKSGDPSDWDTWRSIWSIASLETWLRSGVVYPSRYVV